MESQKPSQKKKVGPAGVVAKQQRMEKLREELEAAQEFEARHRAQVGLLLRGAAAELDRACGWIGRVGEDADEVAGAVRAGMNALAELNQNRIDAWKSELRRLDAARKAWRNAGGDE